MCAHTLFGVVGGSRFLAARRARVTQRAAAAGRLCVPGGCVPRPPSPSHPSPQEAPWHSFRARTARRQCPMDHVHWLPRLLLTLQPGCRYYMREWITRLIRVCRGVFVLADLSLKISLRSSHPWVARGSVWCLVSISQLPRPLLIDFRHVLNAFWAIKFNISPSQVPAMKFFLWIAEISQFRRFYELWRRPYKSHVGSFRCY